MTLRNLLGITLIALGGAALAWGCAAPPAPPPAAPPAAPPAPAGEAPGWLPSMLPDHLLVDDGFTRYRVMNHVDPETQRVSWTLAARFRLFTDNPPRSLLKMRIVQGREAVREEVCDFRPGLGDGPTHIVTESCGDTDVRFEGPATLQVEWHYLHGATDVPTHLRTHTVVIRAVPRVDGEMLPLAPEYIVDQGGEGMTAVLWPRPARGLAYLAPVEAQLAPKEGTYEILLNLSPVSVRPPKDTRMGCLVNGLPVALGGDKAEGKVTIALGAVDSATYRRPPKRKETGAYEEVWSYRQLHLSLPVGHGGGDLIQVAAHPGTWVCTWVDAAGAALRTFHWIVHEDGSISPHAEQFAGMSLAPGAILVDSRIPKSSPLDARTDRAAIQKRAFYGRGFKTANGKAGAKAVPRIGTANPPRR